MIDLNDQVELPAGVEVCEGWLRDDVLGQAYPLAGTASVYLELMRERRRLGVIVAIVARRYDIDEETVAADLIGFVEKLNAGHLVNIRRSPVGWLRMWTDLLVNAALARSFPERHVTRHAVHSGGFARHLLSLSAVLLRNTMPVWLLPAGALMLLGWLLKSELVIVLAPAIAAVFVCLVIHEFGHAIAIRAAGGSSYVITAGWDVAIIHSVTRPAPVIHASGPALAGGVGVGLVLGSLLIGSPFAASLAVPFLLNLAGLTVLSKDGRSLNTAL